MWLPAALAASPVTEVAFPVEIIDDRGKTVVVQQRPETVVSIATFGADLATAFNVKVAGLSSLGNRLPAYLSPKLTGAADLGAAHETNMELLTQLDADLIIAIRQYTEMYEAHFEAMGTFLAYDFITYQQSHSAVLSGAKALGYGDQGQALNNQFDERIQSYKESAPGGLTAVFIWHWSDILWTHYDHSMTVHLMRALNVENALGPSSTPELINPHAEVLTMEALLKLNPDVILSFQAGDRPIQKHPVWPRLKAVQTGRAWRVGQQYVEPFGPIAREWVIQEMAHLFYPDIFDAPEDLPEAARARPMTFK